MEIGIACRAVAGESVCGDAFVVVPGAETLIALVDGLGHGPEAAKASSAFCDFVREHACDSLTDILTGATQAISRTRGAAASLVRLSPGRGTLAFCGVGNVELQALSRDPIRPVCAAGIVGRPLRKVVQYDYRVVPGDLLVLYTDGISSRFELEPLAALAAQAVADALLEGHGKDHDDATCVAVRVEAR